jgi:hypothetical protein
MSTQENHTPIISIANTAISQDAEGRYCLNDLHKASGGHQKDRPKYFLENIETKELITEIETGGIPPSEQNQAVKTIKGGNQQQGTYVVKELVYAYAMWISPAFHLKVIRTFDALVTGQSDWVRVSHDDIRSILASTARLMEVMVPVVEQLASAATAPAREKRPAPSPWTDAEKDQLIGLMAKGLSQNAIARELGRSPASISKYAAIVRVK